MNGRGSLGWNNKDDGVLSNETSKMILIRMQLNSCEQYNNNNNIKRADIFIRGTKNPSFRENFVVDQISVMENCG